MSLTLRLTTTYLLLTLAGMLLLGAGFVWLAGRALAELRERELGAQAELYAALLGELAASAGALQALAPIRPGGELLPPGTAARVFSPAGALLAGDPDLGPFPSRAALALVRPPVPLPASQVAGRHYAARPINGPAGAIGVLELSRDAAADARLLAALRRLAVQAALVAAAVVSVVSVLVARSLARPISAQARRATALAARYTIPETSVGQAGAPVPRNEIAALEASLDRLDAGLRAYLARIDELEQARARFYRGVSHELRTPLTAISATLENLSDTAPATQRPALAVLEAEAARLTRLVDELLRPPADGRLTLAARRPVDLAALVGEVGALLAGRARRAGVSVHTECTGPVLVEGDRDRLKQALLNLADNALRVSPAGGRVRIVLGQAAGHARLAVQDAGPGVPLALRAHIWERGVRGTDPATAGSAGLGLSLVREIAVAHGGRAFLDEQTLAGACFVIELPLSGPTALVQQRS
ncbi:MAG: HAMP domain-containing histidine kinase [Chloroflexi bacterium]|nr:HAMP domain-containing histidine kinase [Chloroflexota bacterium]